MRFNSRIDLGPETSTFTTDQVKNEPMMFNARADWANDHGGPITQDFIRRLYWDNNRYLGDYGSSNDLSLADIVIDSRVHMLMPGWYPCIPGFHHDDVPRLRSDGQPWYPDNQWELHVRSDVVDDEIHLERDSGFYRSNHAMAMYGDNICPTQFALGQAEFPSVPHGQILYKIWHPVVEQHLASGTLEEWFAPMHQIVYFDDRSWHTGQAANGNGWRFFIRASWYTGRVENVTNEIRRQVQVYMENPMEGW
jgi:hypothetical protein